MTPTATVLSKLPGAKRNGSGWQARCPAHEDRNPSLSVSEGDDGRALLKCHAGCETEAVVAALGLRMQDLMLPGAVSPQRPARPTRNVATRRSGDARAVDTPKSTTAHRKPPRTFPTAADAISSLKRKRPTKATHWTYRDADGEPVGVVVRWDLPDGGKQILPVSRTADGWVFGGMPEPRPLYRLPDLLTRPTNTVFVCEGEKASETAASVGLLVTTSAHGSKSAGKTDWSPLAGRDVVILPDNDAPGQQYAETVTNILAKLDPPATVRIVDLPELPEHGDFVEFLDARFDWEPEEIRAEVERLVNEVEPIEVAPVMSTGPVLISMADVEPRDVQWLWPGRVPLGRITLLVGRPGEGKSFLTTDLAARISKGREWPDGTPCPSGSVILVSAEDDPADTIRPRLDSHGADVRQVHLLSAVRHVGKDGKPFDVMFTLADVAALKLALQAHSDCKLIVVDPIGSFLGGDTDAHRDNEVRSVLAPVARLAEQYGPAVLVVAHRRKGTGTAADDLAIGSRAFTGIARAVWHISRDKGDKARRLLLPGKNNLAPEGTGLAFKIVSDPPVIAWEPDPVIMSADDALAADNETASKVKPGPEPDARNAAVDWLRLLLSCGPVAAADVREQARAAGMNYRTVQRAAEALGVKSGRSGYVGGWAWSLPPEADKPYGHVPRESDHLSTCRLGDIDPENAVSTGQVPHLDKLHNPVVLGDSGDSAPGNAHLSHSESQLDKLVEPVVLGASTASPDLVEAMESDIAERAAIREYDGRQDHEQAETAAAAETRGTPC